MKNGALRMVLVVLVTILRCWWQNHYNGDFFITSRTCHQQTVRNMRYQVMPMRSLRTQRTEI